MEIYSSFLILHVINHSPNGCFIFHSSFFIFHYFHLPYLKIITMLNKKLLSLFLLFFSFVTALAQPPAQPINIVITPDHDNWEYKLGEPSNLSQYRQRCLRDILADVSNLFLHTNLKMLKIRYRRIAYCLRGLFAHNPLYSDDRTLIVSGTSFIFQGADEMKLFAPDQTTTT